MTDRVPRAFPATPSPCAPRALVGRPCAGILIAPLHHGRLDRHRRPRSHRRAERHRRRRDAREARVRTRVRQCQARSARGRHARYALRHRLDQQAVHGRRRSCCSQQEGKLSLDDPVSQVHARPHARRTTSRSAQLLSHTSGYQDFWPQDYVLPMMQKPTTPQAIARPLGEAAARLRARHALAVQQHQLRRSPA